MSNHSDSYEGLAARVEHGAECLEYQAEHAAEILPTRAGGDQADPQQWAAEKRAGAAAARQYAAGLRAEATEHGPNARPTRERVAQAERVANAAELGGMLIDGRPAAERVAQSDSYTAEPTRAAWVEGRHPAQQKATEVEATGAFTHVADTVDGVRQVPFWRLGHTDDTQRGDDPQDAAGRGRDDSDEF